MIWVAWVVYVVATFMEEDVVFGGVWIWALTAIYTNHHEEYADIKLQATIVLVAHSVFIVGYGVFLGLKYCKK